MQHGISYPFIDTVFHCGVSTCLVCVCMCACVRACVCVCLYIQPRAYDLHIVLLNITTCCVSDMQL